MENLLDVQMKGANYVEEGFMPKSIGNSAIFHIAFRSLKFPLSFNGAAPVKPIDTGTNYFHII